MPQYSGCVRPQPHDMAHTLLTGLLIGPVDHFFTFVLPTGKAVPLRCQDEDMLLMLTKKLPIAPLPSPWVVLLPVRGQTPLMQQYGVEQVS